MDCYGELANNPEYRCVLYDSATYDGGQLQCTYNSSKKTCEVNTSNCTPIEPIVSEEVGPREECNGSNLVCQEGYTCTAMLQGTLRLCLQDCAEDTTLCEQGNYCDSANVVWSSDAICWGVSGIDGTCLPGSLASEGSCTGVNAECVPNGIGMGHECKRTCSGANVDKKGTEAGCPEDQWCLADQSGYTDGLEYQTGDNGQPLDCSADATICDAEQKYTCQLIRQSNQSKNVCARASGRCGQQVSPVTSFSEASLQLGGGLTDGQFCNQLGKSQYCEGYSEQPNVTAKVECTNLSWGYRLTDNANQPYACSNSADCSIRGTTCINWTQGASCGHIASVCVSFCESADGSEEYTCPADQFCGAPETRVDFIRETGDDGTTRSCANGGTCGEGFVCEEFSDGDFCIRYRKVCRDVPADPCLALNCGENGTCVASEEQASCECAQGYGGTTCSECAPNYILDTDGSCVLSCAMDCGNNGTCNNSTGEAVCECASGYAGTNCETCAADYALFEGECALCPSWYCSDAGTCSIVSLDSPYECTCNAGHTGDQCDQCDTGFVESKINAANCIANPCADNACNGGTCDHGPNDEALCACADGFNPATSCECTATQSFVVLNDTNHCVEDPCLQNTPCSGHGVCTPIQQTGVITTLEKSCACEAGYAGDSCQDCAIGYHLESANNCALNECTCTNGSPATGIACTADQTNICESCEPGYTLQAGECIQS